MAELVWSIVAARIVAPSSAVQPRSVERSVRPDSAATQVSNSPRLVVVIPPFTRAVGRSDTSDTEKKPSEG